ncbi:hypothetical protein PQX77_015893 [Marasmius sp. AFHP31]|nr:hypothetical protein PQX77_015893 [Marasmius sp. AFHP31]
MVSPEEVRRLKMETGAMVEIRVLRNLLLEGHMLERLGSLVVDEWKMRYDDDFADDFADDLTDDLTNDIKKMLGIDRRAQDLPVFEDILQTVEDLIRLDNPRDVHTENLLKAMQALLELQQIPEVDEEALRMVKERASAIVKWIGRQKCKD